MRPATLALAASLLCLSAPSALAQSPNTAAVVVVVKDQSGAAVQAATIRFVNTVTGTARELLSGTDGSATVTALPVTGTYDVTVAKPGFSDEVVRQVALRAGETARLRIRLIVSGGRSDVTVYGTTEGVRSNPQLGVRLDKDQIEAIPLLGRKITSLPLLNAAFRPAKGTGDLFVNATYFVTGAGGRRQPAVTIDGATNDEPWGRQTMFATVPVGAVQELTVLSNAFSAEFGWTAGAAVNIVTRSGTNAVSGEALFLGRPGQLQKKTLPSSAWCAPSIPTCAAPTANGGTAPLAPADIPDSLGQGSLSIGAPLVRDKTHVFVSADYTRQDRTAPITTPLVPAATTVTGHYRQGLVNARLDHKLAPSQSAMLRFNLDRFYDTNPQDAVSGSVLPGAGREFTRHTFSVQGNETAVISGSLLNEARIEYLSGDPITQFEPLTPSTQFTRAGAVPFTSGESRYAHIFSRQTQLSDTLSWTGGPHYVRVGGSAAYSRSGGDGTEFGSAFVLGQFTVNAATTRPIAELTLADMTRYTQSFSLGKATYVQNQWLLAAFAQDSYRVRDDLTLDLGLRYDRQTFSDARDNLAPRVGFAWNPAEDARTVVRGGYGVYYTQLRSNLAANFELGGPEGIFTYAASPGQTGFPTSLGGTPVAFDPNAARSTLPARNITIRPGRRAYYAPLLGSGFAAIPDCTDGEKTTAAGRPCYPGALVNPNSQVVSVGVERELRKGLIAAADYVHQHWTDLDRTVDVNAPAYFERSAPGQVRSTAAADATRPLVPVNGGFRTVNAIENFGVADYDALQTTLSYRAGGRAFASVSYTLSKATNTTEPDGNGIGPNDFNRLGEEERGPSLLDQRHRAVFTMSYQLPRGITAGTVTQLASSRPFNSTTGLDNNGDGASNDRPAIDGHVIGKSAFRGTATSDISLFAEGRLQKSGKAIVLRAEVFNVLNHANILGRVANYGDTGTPNANFGQAAGGLPNIDTPRMFQFQVRFVF